jgi:LruC domain-containing protein
MLSHRSQVLLAKRLGLALLTVILWSGCTEGLPNPVDVDVEEPADVAAQDMMDLIIPPTFQFATARPVAVTVTFGDLTGAPLVGVPVAVLLPQDTTAAVLEGASGPDGVFTGVLPVATSSDSVVIRVSYVGLVSEARVPVINDAVQFDWSDVTSESGASTASPLTTSAPGPLAAAATSLLTLGSWNGSGVPNYLEPDRDTISAALLEDINASLPEYNSVPDAHPAYLADGGTDLSLADSAEVWVTFVHEGAGWRNALAFYTYDLSNPPQTAGEITNLTLVFPNVSYRGSGGGLRSGDKVSLGLFPANTGIGWALVSNGWNGSSVGNGQYLIYSDPRFNPEPDSTLRQHNVLLNDAERGLVLLGFEDVRRDDIPFNCDEDFNDAVFYITASPQTAVATDDLNPIDKPVDTDGDSVSDVYDLFPTDPTRAFLSRFPSANTFGTLAFEDMWPSRGDYDFNDLVVSYQIGHIANGSNQVVALEATVVIEAVGAGYPSGFAFALPLTPSAVASVTGQDLADGYINIESNGVESGQSEAVIVVFDNARRRLPPAGEFTNTVLGEPTVVPDTVRITVDFTGPVSAQALGVPPYNPFLIVNRERGREVHLPGYAPTDLADTGLFGTMDDATVPSLDRYYQTSNNLPWALAAPAPLSYPVERVQIVRGHLRFGNWAESGGASYRDWYQDRPGYRDHSFLFR